MTLLEYLEEELAKRRGARAAAAERERLAELADEAEHERLRAVAAGARATMQARYTLVCDGTFRVGNCRVCVEVSRRDGLWELAWYCNDMAVGRTNNEELFNRQFGEYLAQLEDEQ